MGHLVATLCAVDSVYSRIVPHLNAQKDLLDRGAGVPSVFLTQNAAQEGRKLSIDRSIELAGHNHSRRLDKRSISNLEQTVPPG